MAPRHRFSFLPPSLGDRLLEQATSIELRLYRLPSDPAEGSGDSGLWATFELHGRLPSRHDEAGEQLAALLREFRRPRGGKGGGK